VLSSPDKAAYGLGFQVKALKPKIELEGYAARGGEGGGGCLFLAPVEHVAQIEVQRMWHT